MNRSGESHSSSTGLQATRFFSYWGLDLLLRAIDSVADMCRCVSGWGLFVVSKDVDVLWEVVFFAELRWGRSGRWGWGVVEIPNNLDLQTADMTRTDRSCPQKRRGRTAYGGPSCRRKLIISINH